MDEPLFTPTELRIALIAFALWRGDAPDERTLDMVNRFLRDMERRQ